MYACKMEGHLQYGTYGFFITYGFIYYLLFFFHFYFHFCFVFSVRKNPLIDVSCRPLHPDCANGLNVRALYTKVIHLLYAFSNCVVNALPRGKREQTTDPKCLKNVTKMSQKCEKCQQFGIS